MSRKLVFGFSVVLLFLVAVAFGTQTRPKGQEKPFGGSDDAAFAKKIWRSMEGYEKWKLTTNIYKGTSPHGKWLRLYSTFITVDGKSYPIIVKDNYGGRGVTPERVKEKPEEWLKAVTIMLKREADYDSANQDWFYVKFDKSGNVLKNPKGMLLAGRVAKGATKGCISCHSQARGNDYLYSNDE